MTAIEPTSNQLIAYINSDKYREILIEISGKYEQMESYITNLNQDIGALEDFINKLKDDALKGYDVKESILTLSFQRDCLKVDLKFYSTLKETYINKLYHDLSDFADDIIIAALEIELTGKKSEDEMNIEINKKYGDEVKPFLDSVKYEMGDITKLLTVIIKNLIELANDIQTFEALIVDAIDKANRGFAVGNLILNLKQQKKSLEGDFILNTIKLGKFMEDNNKFANRSLSRVEMISKEIKESKQNAPIPTVDMPDVTVSNTNDNNNEVDNGGNNNENLLG